MKNLYSIIAALLLTASVFSQVPQYLSYQAIVRKSDNVPDTSANIGMQISILQGSSAGKAVYVETQSAKTNSIGLVTVEIGNGNAVSGKFSSINWAAGPYYILVQTDPEGGSNYTISGTSQLLSVPYALYAGTSGSSNGWSLTGNAGTLDTVDFIGTTDRTPFNIKVNNMPSGRIDSTSGNTFYGYESGNFPADKGIQNTVVGMQSLLSNTTGNDNTALGYHSLVDNTIGGNNVGYGFCTLVKNQIGSSNTALGNWTLFLNTASYNTAVGDSALYANTTGTGNAAVGYQALTANTTGIQNTVVGMQSLLSNTTGNDNTAMGYHSLVDNTIGGNNVGYGFCTLVKNQIGSSNTALGNWTLFLNTASYNTAVGDSALYANTTGTGNAAVGYQALTANTTGIQNTVVGMQSLLSNTTGNDNTAMGYHSLVDNTIGGNNVGYGFCTLVKNQIGSSNTALGNWTLFLNTASYNTAVGDSALYANTTGTGNAAVGYQALTANTTGIQNTVVGMQSLLSNTTGNDNTAMGYHSLVGNTIGGNNVGYGFCTLVKNQIGSSNTALGNWTLFLNTASYNTASGDSALYANTTGTGNAAVGYQALTANTTGSNNTAFGDNALYTNTNGCKNTAIGSWADVGASNTNSTAIGYQATANESNVIVLGNSSIQKLYCAQTSITAISDGRFKKNIKSDIHGLDFIMKLKPVSYNLDVVKLNAYQGKQTEGNDLMAAKQAENIVHNGFLAQDVEEAAKEVNYNFSGLKTPENSKDIYGLGYTDFVVPLVKAVQELKTTNDSLKNENEMLKTALANQEKNIIALQNIVSNNATELAMVKKLVSDKTEKAVAIKLQ